MEILESINPKSIENLSKEQEKWLENKYGISSNTIQASGVGFINGEIDFEAYSPEEKYKSGFFNYNEENEYYCYIRGYYIFPVLENNRVVSYYTRKYGNEDKYKSLHLKKSIIMPNGVEERTLVNSKVAYSTPESMVFNRSDIFIVEGVGDALAIAENIRCMAIALGTNTINDNKLDDILLKVKGYKNIYIWADSDENKAGINGAIKSFNLLLENKVFSKIIVNNRQKYGKDAADYFINKKSKVI